MSAIWDALSSVLRAKDRTQSYLDVASSGKTATFRGTLDIKTLGGAGFASRKVSGDWNLSEYAAISLNVAKGDK